RPLLPAKGLDGPEESIHYEGIKLRASAAAQFSQGLFRGAGLPIGTGGNHGGEGIGYCHNAGAEGYLLPSQAVRITLPVEGLMVVAHDALDGYYFQRFHYLRAPLGMAFHDLALFRRQERGLVEHGVRHMDLADIVNDARQTDLFDFCLG